jgi:hypothetical protein
VRSTTLGRQQDGQMSNNIERVLAKLTEMEGSLQSLKQSVRFAIENLYRQFEAYQSLLALIKPAFPLPPLRGWALSPVPPQLEMERAFHR